MFGEESQRCRHPEQQREEVREFLEQPQPQRLARRGLDAIRAELGQAPRRLALGETRRAAAQIRQRLGGG
jgi:hypothetical protein